jgi:hypothetical protein
MLHFAHKLQSERERAKDRVKAIEELLNDCKLVGNKPQEFFSYFGHNNNDDEGNFRVNILCVCVFVCREYKRNSLNRN